jgi:ParB-like chromosome segregation protein Spo0J
MNDTTMKLPPAAIAYEYVAHELANLLPMIQGDEFENLKADIKKNGILQPIALYDDGSGLKILDGRNRYAAAKAVGFKLTSVNFTKFTGDKVAAKAFVLSTNFHRRHLTNEQKRDLIRGAITENPGASDREIARMFGVSHVTVGTVKKEILNSPEQKRFNRFMKDWDQLSDDQRSTFVKQNAADIREML